MIINFGVLGNGGGGGGSTTIIDNLDSTATTAALSANQGKVLGDHIGDAEEVVARGFTQLGNDLSSRFVAKTNMSISQWSDIEGFGDGIYDLYVNNTSEGKRLHVNGAATELTNPRVDQITTSETVLRIVTLTQDEYDALEQGGNLNNNTLYAIVEPLP